MKKYLFNTQTGYMTCTNPSQRQLKTETTGERPNRVVTKLNEIRSSQLTFEAGETLQIVDDEIVVVPKPAKPVVAPTLVTAAQFKCALGVTRFTQIESVLAAMPDVDEQFEYTQYWLNTTEFKIDHPMVVAMQVTLGWSDAERDQLFVDAGNK